MSLQQAPVLGHSVKITLPSDSEFMLTRVFNAPRAMVFDALTKPDLVKRWFGPPPERGWAIAVCEADLRTGGEWRIEMRKTKPPAAEIILRGVYREFARPERLVATQLMEGCDGQGESEAVATTLLVEHAGKTTFTQTVRYPSKDVRDNVLKSGGVSEEGMSLIYDKLAVLLASGDLNP